MTHLSITFPEDLKVALDKEAKHEHTKRSTLIQKAVKVYLEIKKQKTTAQLLKEGYLEMADLDREMLDEFKCLDAESLKYADYKR